MISICKSVNLFLFTGSEAKPFKTVLRAMNHAKQEPLPDIFVDGKDDTAKYELISQAQKKKIKKIWVCV